MRLINMYKNKGEDREMKESQYILNAIQRGYQKGIIEAGRENLLTVLQVKFSEPVSELMRLAIEGTNDPDLLRRWFTAALHTDTLADFVATMTPTAQSGPIPETGR